ncbi:MAG: hypothetical protein ACRDK7_14935 [Solirubrobacteraceae bacterium]
MKGDANSVPWWAGPWVRLTALLSCLAVLVLYVLGTWSGVLGDGTDAGPSRTGGAWAVGCPARGAPPVVSVAPGRLAELREGLRHVVQVDAVPRRLYSLGTITSENAWTDNYPQRDATSLPEGARVPAAYEMRWWITRTDLVADVFVFSGAGEARDFFERASSSRCRLESARVPTVSPTGARDLVWRNPGDVVQEDAYVLHGSRVYRIAAVRDNQGIRQSDTEQRIGFAIVNRLSCALPNTDCRILDLRRGSEPRTS